ncbi:MAG: DUF2490 domain-containing protein [Flavobacteriaceae bacterium]|jgi:hypothetical protein
MKRFIIIGALVLGTFFSYAQEYEKVVGAWNALFLNNKLADQWHLTTELHHRTINGLVTLDQHIFRPSLNYKSPSGFQWTAGYSYLQNYNWDRNATPRFLKEQNIWEQLKFSLKGKKGETFTNQFRLEHRFIEQSSGPKKYAFSSRIRYRFTYAYPLFVEQWKGDVKLVVYDEIFLILNPQGIPYRFNQNWTFLGFNIKLGQKANLSTGIQKNTISRGNNRYLMNRFLNSTLRYTF